MTITGNSPGVRDHRHRITGPVREERDVDIYQSDPTGLSSPIGLIAMIAGLVIVILILIRRFRG